jgi:hypothetical protein
MKDIGTFALKNNTGVPEGTPVLNIVVENGAGYTAGAPGVL